MPKTKMDAGIKQEWIDALRSGEYPQTKGRLVRTRLMGDEEYPPGYCCLGVLSEILVKHGILVRVEENSFNPVYAASGADEVLPEDMSLHPAAIEAIELDDDSSGDYPNPEVMVYFDSLPKALLSAISNYIDPKIHDGATLATMNDKGAPFSLIADVVEAGIEGV